MIRFCRRVKIFDQAGIRLPILRFTMNVKVNNCDALRNLIPFVQFKKREKHPWRSVNFSKVAG